MRLYKQSTSIYGLILYAGSGVVFHTPLSTLSFLKGPKGTKGTTGLQFLSEPKETMDEDV